MTSSPSIRTRRRSRGCRCIVRSATFRDRSTWRRCTCRQRSGQSILPDLAASGVAEVWLNPGSETAGPRGTRAGARPHPIEACSIVGIGDCARPLLTHPWRAGFLDTLDERVLYSNQHLTRSPPRHSHPSKFRTSSVPKFSGADSFPRESSCQATTSAPRRSNEAATADRIPASADADSRQRA